MNPPSPVEGACGDRADPGSGQRLLGHYELLEKLGEGGMGLVFRARDTRLGRHVALKVLPASKVGDAKRKQRFVREAMLASALNHPHIVIIHDIDSDQGRDFIVMELVEGTSLHDAIPEGGLEAERALPYALQIASAMVAAHDAGIVHRDLKPQNVMVTRSPTSGGDDDSHGTIKVLDFGVAKLNPLADPDPDDITLTQLTGHGETVGTLAYMSPEQLRSEPVDARSDIFSLGVMCYQMLTGRRPFHGAQALDLAHEIYFTDPEPMTRWRPDLPTAVDEIIARALRKQRSERQPSMEALRSELAACLPAVATSSALMEDSSDGVQMPIAANQPGTGERNTNSGSFFDIATASRRGRWMLPAVLAILGVLALTQEPAMKWLAGALAGNGHNAVPAAQLSTRDLYLQGLDRLEHYYQPGNLDQAIDALQRVLARDRESAAAYAGLARAYLRKYYNEGKDRTWREKALASARRAVDLNPDLASARASLGLVLVDLKEFDEAQTHLRQALLLDPFNADAYRGQGKLHERRGDFEQAEAIYRRALEIRPNDRRLHDLLGSVLYRTGRYPQAETSFLRSIELAPDAPFGHKNLAAVYHMQGKFPQAADQLQRAIELRPTAGLYTNLGTLYFYQGLYQEALAAFLKTFDFKGSSNSFRRWANLADAYRWTPDNQQQAKDAYLRAVQLLREDLALSPGAPQTHSQLALMLAKRGDCAEALAEVATLEDLGSQDGAIRFRATVAYEVCGQRQPALQSLKQALAADYSLEEIRRDPELLDLRDDLRYHRLLMDHQKPR